jgi:PAS domain S-box-containing protein
MTTSAQIIHDTRRIVSVNAEACELFRCDESALVDLDMFELIAHPDFRGLARLRMKMMRQLVKIRNIKYKFLRCDGATFWGTVTTEGIGNGLFETTIVDEH